MNDWKMINYLEIPESSHLHCILRRYLFVWAKTDSRNTATRKRGKELQAKLMQHAHNHIIQTIHADDVPIKKWNIQFGKPRWSQCMYGENLEFKLQILEMENR